jgi:hypothetical protein
MLDKELPTVYIHQRRRASAHVFKNEEMLLYVLNPCIGSPFA